jgi:immunoglobulin-binding protein 1
MHRRARLLSSRAPPQASDADRAVALLSRAVTLLADLRLFTTTTTFSSSSSSSSASSAASAASRDALDDLPTADLRFIIVPALRAAATLQRRPLPPIAESPDGRCRLLLAAAADYMAFLAACDDLGLCSAADRAVLRAARSEFAKVVSAADRAVPAVPAGPLGAPLDPAAQRAAKIAAYKREKEAREKLKELSTLVELAKLRTAESGSQLAREQARAGGEPSPADDTSELDRESVLQLITLHLQLACNDLDAVFREYCLLRAPRPTAADYARTRATAGPARPPMVITREMLQQQVFGAGYRSLPTMTVEQWGEVEMQRMAQQSAEQQRKQLAAEQARVLREGRDDTKAAEEREESRMREAARAAAAQGPQQAGQSSIDDDEGEEADGAPDDEQKLRDQRAWDDYKDTHKRGWGNRKNMG